MNSRLRSSRTPVYGQPGPQRPSPTRTPTSSSRLDGSKPTRSWSTRRFAGSCTRSRPASCTRSSRRPAPVPPTGRRSRRACDAMLSAGSEASGTTSAQIPSRRSCHRFEGRERQLNVFGEIMTPPEGSVRDRLVAAFALLEGHGIASRTAFPERPEEAARLLVGEIRGRHPDATGAWVLWTRRDDRAAFDQSGELLSPLTLYCSSPDVAQATLAA